MIKEDFEKLEDLDKLLYLLKASKETHLKHLHKPYWKGSHNMILSVEDSIEQIKSSKLTNDQAKH